MRRYFFTFINLHYCDFFLLRIFCFVNICLLFINYCNIIFAIFFQQLLYLINGKCFIFRRNRNPWHNTRRFKSFCNTLDSCKWRKWFYVTYFILLMIFYVWMRMKMICCEKNLTANVLWKKLKDFVLELVGKVLWIFQDIRKTLRNFGYSFVINTENYRTSAVKARNYLLESFHFQSVRIFKNN